MTTDYEGVAISLFLRGNINYKACVRLRMQLAFATQRLKAIKEIKAILL